MIERLDTVGTSLGETGALTDLEIGRAKAAGEENVPPSPLVVREASGQAEASPDAGPAFNGASSARPPSPPAAASAASVPRPASPMPWRSGEVAGRPLPGTWKARAADGPRDTEPAAEVRSGVDRPPSWHELGDARAAGAAAGLRRSGATPASSPVHITIGRVEVRAVLASPAAPTPPVSVRPRLSLDDYLKERQRSRR